MAGRTYTVRLRGDRRRHMEEAAAAGLSRAEYLRACIDLAMEADLLNEMDSTSDPAHRSNQVDADEIAGGDVASSEVGSEEEHGGGVTAADLAREEAGGGAAQNDDPPEPEDPDDDGGDANGGDWFEDWE